MRNFFIESLLQNPGVEIIATFRDGSAAIYTTNIFNLLASDPEVENIINAETGEVVFYRN